MKNQTHSQESSRVEKLVEAKATQTKEMTNEVSIDNDITIHPDTQSYEELNADRNNILKKYRSLRKRHEKFRKDVKEFIRLLKKDWNDSLKKDTGNKDFDDGWNTAVNLFLERLNKLAGANLI